MGASEKCPIMTFIDIDICHRMGPLRKLYSVTLTNIFKVKNSNLNISEPVGASKNARHDFHRGLHSPTNGVTANVVLAALDLNFQD